MIRNTKGIVLVTGPTGSGKTTTLYALLRELYSPERNIVTVEDPVEYVLEGINQSQVNPKVGFTFASALRAFLRQDPDILMVGEIRDSETAQVAIRAATTGHLVLSTLHTNDAAGAVNRLLDMGAEPFLLSSSLLGVIAQRLVRVLCPQCRVPYEPQPGQPEWIYLNLAGPPPVLYRAAGCGYCGYTGYRGRIAIHEVLVLTPRLQNLINQKAPATLFKKEARDQGMTTLWEDGIARVLQGITSLQELLRVVTDDEREDESERHDFLETAGKI